MSPHDQDSDDPGYADNADTLVIEGDTIRSLMTGSDLLQLVERLDVALDPWGGEAAHAFTDYEDDDQTLSDLTEQELPETS